MASRKQPQRRGPSQNKAMLGVIVGSALGVALAAGVLMLVVGDWPELSLWSLAPLLGATIGVFLAQRLNRRRRSRPGRRGSVARRRLPR